MNVDGKLRMALSSSRVWRRLLHIGWTFAAVAVVFLASATNAAEPVRVLAAFTLKPALDEIAEGYRKGGAEVVLVYGPSPGFAQQVENGIAADLFLSADPMWTDELAQHQLIKTGTVTDLVGNHLVLIGKKARRRRRSDRWLSSSAPDRW
jgi:molybdate transport system substrate-binding protein